MYFLNDNGTFVRRAAALAVILGASVAMSAQTSQNEPAAKVVVAEPVLNLSTTSTAVSSSSSSSSDADENSVVATVATDPLHLDAMQYGGRQRYQRPRYRGGNTNADGSNKYMFYGGAGFGQPAGNTWKYFTPNYGIQVGGGRQLSEHFAVPIEFNFDTFGLTKQAMANQAYIYTGDSNAADYGIDANAHIWSFSISPRYTFSGAKHGGTGAYVLATAGFYHKVTNFTAPQTQDYYDPYSYSGYDEVEVQGNFDHYTSNAPGFGAGVGLTYKFSRFSNERFYAEARYIFIDNSQRYGATVNNVATYNGDNAFPANSNRTTYFPVKFGIQF